MLLRKSLSFVLLAALLVSSFVSAPPGAAAAAVELTVAVKASFDKTSAAADAKTAAALNALYNDLSSLLKEDKELEAKIKAQRYRNEETLIALRKQIREIDAPKLARLAQQTQQAKARYQPLFDAYSALNKQITLAKGVKNKTLNALLRTQADAMKLSVQFAREEIKEKEAAHKAARTAASNKIKAARDSLASIEKLKVQIKAQRSAASLPRSSRSPVWANFKYAIKRNDARGSQDSLSTLVMLSRQIVEQQKKIQSLELRIADSLSGTKAQFL
ncbi:hypothetical protein [Cohnella boryungensis]|uniref:Uncharacterized protein n=1 Tax=Cohnella boryungensis TaxID=768479 RepID=A0ABV8S7B6_9BACL